MNDVPPSQPPSDDVDSFYRRASALDPSRPSDRTRQAVLAHAKERAAASKHLLTGEAPAMVESDRTAPASMTTITTKLRRRERWWRPALFGTLAAAGLAGLLVLPRILTPHVAPRTTYATFQRSDLTASAPATAAPTPQVARPPAATAKRSATTPLARADEYVEPTTERDATGRRETKAHSAQRIDAMTGASAGAPGGAGARKRSVPSEPESLTVTAQRREAKDLSAQSPMAAIAPSESSPQQTQPARARHRRLRVTHCKRYGWPLRPAI